jgi:hypothetical protein
MCICIHIIWRSRLTKNCSWYKFLTNTVDNLSFAVVHHCKLEGILNCHLDPSNVVVHANNYYIFSEFQTPVSQRTLTYWTLRAFIMLVCMLTFDVQKDGHVDLWFRVHLTFVYAGVSLLNIFHPQVPLVWGLWVYHSEPRISGVCKDIGRQNVQVAFSHPWHLKISANILSPLFTNKSTHI